MVKKASSLSPKQFSKLVSGGKNYLPKKIQKELKLFGITANDDRINKNQAIKALRYLRNKKLGPAYQPPSKLFERAAVEQYKIDEQARKAELAKHVRANIMLEIQDEAEDLEELDDYLWSNPRYRRSRRVIEAADLERKKREKKINAERAKRGQLLDNKAVKPNKPGMLEFNDLPDMNIG